MDIANNIDVQMQYRKKFRCADITWILYVLKFTHRVIIDICINAPGHGRSKIVTINVSEKTYLELKMCKIVTAEYNNQMYQEITSSRW